MTTLVTAFLRDLRHALRQFRHAPGFTLTVVLTLAIAIGATSAMVGILRATLLNPLPYPHASQLVAIADHNLRGFKTNGIVSVLRAVDLTELQHDGHPVFSRLGYLYSDDSTLAIDNQTPIRIPAVGVSGTFFSTIATQPLLGRTVLPADEIKNAPEVVVLSHHLWATVFASDPHVLGRIVRLGTVQATVIGVMPQEFNLPAGIDLWHPGHISAANFSGYRGDGSRFVTVFARLHSNETLASATQQSALLAAHLASAYPESDAAWGFELNSLRDSLFGDYRHALLLLAAAVGLVLLVATVNIASLQLSRNAVRAPEFAIRTALGVTRGRLVRQLLTESILLVLAGSLVGVALAAALLRAMVTQLPSALVRVQTPHVDLAVLALSCTIALVVGLLTGIVPALRSIRSSPSLSGSRTTVGSTRLLGKGFTALQIALALVLLTLSAAVLQSLYSLLHTPLGYDAAQLQTFTVDLPWGYDEQKTHRLYQQLEEQLAAMPGVTSVGSINALPLSSFSGRRTFDIAGAPLTPQHDAVVAEGRGFSPGYLRTMRIPLLAGRTFVAQDSEPEAPDVLLINQTLANRYFRDRNPIGQRLTYRVGVTGNAMTSSEIVGVIGDVHGTGGSLSSPVQPEVYFAGGGGWPHMQFALRTPLASSALEPTIRRLVPSLDASASLGHYSTLSASLDTSFAQPRLNAALLTAFASLSLLLVIVGVYGLVAFDVAQRTRELGLRIALGSSRGGVLLLLLLDSTRILAGGLVLGLAGSWLASRSLSATLPGAREHTALLLLVTSLLLSAAVLIATLIPARRAAIIDPMTALRTE